MGTLGRRQFGETEWEENVILLAEGAFLTRCYKPSSFVPEQACSMWDYHQMLEEETEQNLQEGT